MLAQGLPALASKSLPCGPSRQLTTWCRCMCVVASDLAVAAISACACAVAVSCCGALVCASANDENAAAMATVPMTNERFMGASCRAGPASGQDRDAGLSRVKRMRTLRGLVHFTRGPAHGLIPPDGTGRVLQCPGEDGGTGGGGGGAMACGGAGGAGGTGGSGGSIACLGGTLKSSATRLPCRRNARRTALSPGTARRGRITSSGRVTALPLTAVITWPASRPGEPFASLHNTSTPGSVPK